MLVSMGFGVHCLTPLSYTGLIGRMKPFTSHGSFEHDLGLVNKKDFASYEHSVSRRCSEAVPLGYQNRGTQTVPECRRASVSLARGRTLPSWQRHFSPAFSPHSISSMASNFGEPSGFTYRPLKTLSVSYQPPLKPVPWLSPQDTLTMTGGGGGLHHISGRGSALN